jgi:hypothetical protein
MSHHDEGALRMPASTSAPYDAVYYWHGPLVTGHWNVVAATPEEIPAILTRLCQQGFPTAVPGWAGVEPGQEARHAPGDR